MSAQKPCICGQGTCLQATRVACNDSAILQTPHVDSSPGSGCPASLSISSRWGSEPWHQASIFSFQNFLSLVIREFQDSGYNFGHGLSLPTHHIFKQYFSQIFKLSRFSEEWDLSVVQIATCQERQNQIRKRNSSYTSLSKQTRQERREQRRYVSVL